LLGNCGGHAARRSPGRGRRRQERPAPPFRIQKRYGYHIGPGSAAIDRGMDAGVMTDIDGDPRPIGSLPDIGADEARRWVYLPLLLR
jgi:hypothetical protein